MQFGRYELVERIGAGGMAEVFLAIQRGPRGVAKRLVIKRIAASHARDPRYVALFEREARIGCELTHSNLVSVFEFGRVADHWFIAMEHVDGRDLGAALDAARERGEPMPAALVAHVATEVCRGLAHIHARGYVHRDVTPRNVLMSWDGLVKLSDYGLAIPGDRDGDRGVRGTRGFMSPEQAAGGTIDRRADLYSVGAMIAYAGTGDERLAAVAVGAMAHDPSERFTSADALRAALEPIAAGIDDRTLATWLEPRGPRDAPAPRAVDEPTRSAPDEVRTVPPASDPVTASTAGDRAPTPLDPLGALLGPVLGPPARPRRGRNPGRRATVALLIVAAAALAGGRYVFTAGANAAPRLWPMPCRDGDGYYCGRTLRTFIDAPAGEIDDNTLYLCNDGWAHVKEVCELGCEVRPPGEADICQWRTPRFPKPSPAPHAHGTSDRQ